MTDLRVQDGEGLSALIDAISKPIDAAIGDGAYDQYKNHTLSKKRKFKLIAPPRRDAKLTKNCTGHSTIQKHTSEMLEALKQRDL